MESFCEVLVIFCLQCTSQNTSRVSLSQKQMYRYKIKIINEKKKSLYVIKPLHDNKQFTTLSDLRDSVKEEIGKLRGALGYIEPGHGSKGKVKQLYGDEDLADMYTLHKRGDILLWCYDCTCEGSSPESRKRPADTPAAATTSSKRECIATTINNVETIVAKLKEKHGKNRYPIEQFNCWAHMINSGKCSSYDTPPDLPFFKKPPKKGKETEQTSHSNDNEENGSSKSASVAASPTKRLNLRMQCIDQLSKWHVLLESGAIVNNPAVPGQVGELQIIMMATDSTITTRGQSTKVTN